MLKGEVGWTPAVRLLLPALLALVSGGAAVQGCGEASGGDSAREARATREGSDAEQASGELRVDPATGRLVRTQRIRVGGVPITVEIADTPDLRGRGLMHRESLPEDYGMLFVYAEPSILSFWMRNTLIPLDIAFVDANGVIVNIDQMEPQTETQHEARAPSLYALEMRQGWFAEHGIGPGDQVEF